MLDINRIVVTRLVLAWLIVSLFTGATIYLVESKRIDDAVIAFASAEAQRFSPEGIDTKGMTPDQLESLRHKALEFATKYFVLMKGYDYENKLLFDIANPAFAHIRSVLAQSTLTFPRNGAHHYQKLAIDGETLVQIQVPLHSTGGSKAGYFEGVFVIPAEEIARLNRDFYRLLLISLLCVLCTTLLLYPVIISLSRRVIRFSDQVIKGNLEIVTVLGAAIAKRDSNTGSHNYRVTLYAIRLGEAVGTEKVDMSALILGAFLHDVGKIGIRDNILLKPTALNDEEQAVMHTHVQLGIGIVQTSEWLHAAHDVIKYHHEKYDGSGYLKGLRGEDIPLAARIFAIVDVFDALTSRRPYKDAWPVDEALERLSMEAGGHFDPQLVAIFQKIAADLYRQFGLSSESDLHASLRQLVKDHYRQLLTQQ